MSIKGHFVYAVRGVESGRVKIGHSANPANRLAGLQTGSPETLALISGRRFEDERQAVAFESLMHAKFAQDRIHDEWFAGSEALLSEVTSQAWLSPEDLIEKYRARRIPVLMNKDVYDRVKAYADAFGMPVTRAFHELATDWMNTVGEARMEGILQTYSATAGSN